MLCVRTLAVAVLLASAAQANEAPALRVREDPLRDRLWMLKPNGVHLHSLKTRERLRHVPLAGWHWAGPPYSCPPDLALGPRGEALVTSDIAPILWRVDSRTLTVSVHELRLDPDIGMDVGFSGLIYLPDRREYLAVSHIGSLWSIDRGLVWARKLRLSAAMPRACGVSNRPGLCVRGEETDWAVELAADRRSASVRATRPCEPRVEEAGAGSGRSTGR